MKRFVLAVLFVLAAFGSSSPALAGTIDLSAAASLREVLKVLSDGFARTHPGVDFRTNLGASGTLAQQIENGAPADLFISANDKWLEYLKAKGLVAGKNTGVLAYNTLVFAGRDTGKVAGMADLVTLDRIAIGSPKSVPAGEYAMEALRSAGLDRKLAKKLVMAKDVRQSLMYADRGEVDGAFVYRTDVLEAAKSARILFTVPQKLYGRVGYGMGLTAKGAGNGEAVAFYRYLLSPAARAILEKSGYAVR